MTSSVVRTGLYAVVAETEEVYLEMARREGGGGPTASNRS